MAATTLTLKLPFLNLNQNRVAEFERLQSLNTKVANEMLKLSKEERRRLTTKDFADLEIASAFINQTIRNANARTNAKEFQSLPLETNNQNWKLTKIGPTYSVIFNLTRDRTKRLPIEIHTAKHSTILDALLNGSAKAGSLKLWRAHTGIWYALISLSMEVPDKTETERWSGVDRGQRHLAVVSSPEGNTRFFSFGHIRNIRRHFANLRRRLQKRGKYRVVKKLEQKERRIIRHINHIISKEIVCFAQQHNSGIRLEELKGIRSNSKQRQKTKADAGANRDYWPYYDLEQKILYKAQMAGIAVEKIPAAFTSKACCKCHAIGNRVGEKFSCERCGYQGHADHNASRNIGQWLGMACLIELKPAEAVMASVVQSSGVYGTPLISVNTQQVSLVAVD